MNTSRRNFLRMAGLGVAAVAVGGGVALAAPASPIEDIEAAKRAVWDATGGTSLNDLAEIQQSLAEASKEIAAAFGVKPNTVIIGGKQWPYVEPLNDKALAKFKRLIADNTRGLGAKVKITPYPPWVIDQCRATAELWGL